MSQAESNLAVGGIFFNLIFPKFDQNVIVIPDK